MSRRDAFWLALLVMVGIAATVLYRGRVEDGEKLLKAQQRHLVDEARGDSLMTAASRSDALAAYWKGKADSLKARRAVVVRKVLAAPDSTALAMGIEAAPDSAGRRCIPLPDFAELLAARAALPYCDSTTDAQAARAVAAESAAVTYHTAAVVARGDAAQLSRALEVEAASAAAARRRAWWFAAGGVAAGAAAVLLLGGAQ